MESERIVVRRPYSTYVIPSVPRPKELLKMNLQADLLAKWPWLDKLSKTRFDFLLQKHVKVTSRLEPVDKKSIGNLFRAIGNKVLPGNFLGSSPNALKTFLENVNGVFLAGKATSIEARDLLRRIQTTDPDIEKLVVWLAENLFWNVVKCYFHVCTTSSSRHELQYFHKSHYQSACQRYYQSMLKENRLKKLSKAQVVKIIKNVPGAPKIARVHLKPKANLSSLRMIARREKDGNGHSLESTRYLLNEISKRFFNCSIDVKGKHYSSTF